MPTSSSRIVERRHKARFMCVSAETSPQKLIDATTSCHGHSPNQQEGREEKLHVAEHSQSNLQSTQAIDKRLVGWRREDIVQTQIHLPYNKPIDVPKSPNTRGEP